MEPASSGWVVHGEQVAYEHRGVRVAAVDVTAPGGERFDYQVVEMAPVAVAAIVREGSVLLLWKHRFPTDQWGYELPGGVIEPGEDPAVTAAREALEESGWGVRGDPEPLITVEPLPGSVRARTRAYRWVEADRVGEPSDPDEVATVSEWVPLDRAPGLARDGKLLGAATTAVLLYLHATAREQP